jgi:hypothetical protein
MPGPGTSFSGPLQVGSKVGTDFGSVALAQQVTLVQNSTTAVTQTITLPGGSVILDIYADSTTAWNSATSATLSIGTAAAGTQYGGSVDLKSATARQRPAWTAAQLNAMSSVSATTPQATLFITSTVVGATSAGTTIVTVVYLQTVQASLGVSCPRPI